MHANFRFLTLKMKKSLDAQSWFGPSLPLPYKKFESTKAISDQSKSGICLIGLGWVCDIKVHMF